MMIFPFIAMNKADMYFETNFKLSKNIYIYVQLAQRHEWIHPALKVKLSFPSNGTSYI
jgi:hypothetical protein